MRDKLAEEILGRVMGWTPADAVRERPAIQALAAYKYDGYQQFSPGMRFVESFGRWLSQFETAEEKKIAYDFVLKKLIFLSESEFKHLVGMAYPDFIRPLLLESAARKTGFRKWELQRIAKSEAFRVLQRQSLYLGLSDGSRTDYFRRSGSPEVIHEQVRTTQEIAHPRADEMIRKLKTDLESILGRPPTADESCFRSVFLLDDFSASGVTQLRKENGSSTFTGKLAEFYSYIAEEDGSMFNLVSHDELTVYLVLYVATTSAVNHLQSLGPELFGKVGFDVLVVCPLDDSCKIQEGVDKQLDDLLVKYYDKSIEDSHYRKGKDFKPFLGFNECGLPLILAHNTPNNSLPLLWYGDGARYRGLFPRIARHVDKS